MAPPSSRLRRGQRRQLGIGLLWAAVGLVSGAAGGAFVGAAILTLAGRGVLGLAPHQVGLVLTGGGPLAVLPWLVGITAAGRGMAGGRVLVWLVPAWLIGGLAAAGGAVWTAGLL